MDIPNQNAGSPESQAQKPNYNSLLQPSTAPKSPTFVSRIKSIGRRPLIFIGAVLLLVAAFGTWKLFFDNPIPAKFTLEATLQDDQGTSAGTAFKLHSTQSLSASEIERILKFDPPIEFTAKQASVPNSFINVAQAQDNNSGSFTYELQPKEKLQTDIVYQALINDQEYSDREYGWAFQIKSDFQVVSTHPGKQTTHVPVNSGIETTFNRTGVENFNQHFSISPSVEGTFESFDNKAVFLPKKPLANNTVYTVTITKGVKGQGSDEALTEDYVFSFETKSSYYASSYVNFTSDFVEAPTKINPNIGVYVYNYKGTDATVNVYKIPTADEFLDSYQKSRKWEWGWTSYYRQTSSSSFDTAGKQPIASFQPTIVTQSYRSYFEIPQALEPGMYVVDLNVDGARKQAWLQVSDAAQYFSITNDTSLVWLYNYSSNSALQNAKVEFVQKDSSTQTLGNSDKDGLVQFNTPESLKPTAKTQNTNPSFFKITAGNSIKFAKIQDRWGYRSSVDSPDNYWKFISTDRYTYQMTDTVKFWGVVKSRKEDVRQKRLTVAIYGYSGYWNGNRQPIASTEVAVTPFNTYEGSFSFTGLDPDTYNIQVKLGDELVTQSSIEVLTYSKPSFQIGVSTSKPAIFAGDSVAFKVKGTFFDGTPLANTALDYSYYWDSSIGGQVTLDNNGEAEVSITPKYDNNPNSYYPRALAMHFSPSSAEEGEISGSASVLVFGPHMYLQAYQKTQAGDDYTFQAKLNNIDINNQVPDSYGGFRTEYIGSPVSNYPVTAKITKITYDQVETGNYYDPINKVVNKTYKYVRNEQQLETVNGTTDGNGEWNFNRNLPKTNNTYYQVVFSVTDREGRATTSNTYAFYDNYDEWKPSGLTLSIGGESYEKEFSVNDTVNLTVQGRGKTEVNNKSILFYRFQNNISRANVVYGTNYSEIFGNDFLPSVQYRAVVLSPYGFEESNSVYAIFDKADNNLDIGITTDKENYRPGDKVTVKLNVKDKNGQPVKGETNVAIVDEAVFHVLPYNYQQEILDSLYRPIYTSPFSGWTEYLLPKGIDEEGDNAEQGGCFVAGTQILLANGKSKNIEDIKVGDQILTLKDAASRKLVPAVVQGVSQHQVDEYLVINDSLGVTPEHKIFLNGEWNYAGNAKVGDSLLLKNNVPEIITSILSKKIARITVYNIVVGTYHTYFADGYFVHNAEKGGSARTNFVDTASFQSLHPDNNGNAEFEFTAPDNITSWRVTARAFEANSLKAGEETKLVPVTLPLFINTVFNDTYLVGDNPQVKVSVYGTNYRPDQAADMNVKVSGLNIDQKLSLKNHVANLSLNSLPEGEYDVTVSVQQGELKDAIQKHISVVKNYFTKPTINTQTVTNGQMQINGNNNGYTRLKFVDAGRGRYYQELLWNSYTGGIRADQITASYYAQQLLNQYFGDEKPADSLDLSLYQSYDGIRLFPYSDPDLELTVKVADLAKDHVNTNDVGDYLARVFYDKKTDVHRQAIALYGLGALRKPVLTRLQNIKSVPDLTWQDKIYVALGLAKIGALEEARQLYQKDIRPHLNFDGPQAWYQEISDETARIKLTNLTGVLTAHLGLTEDSDKLWGYMTSHAPTKDLDMLEKVMFIKSAIAHVPESEATFTYATSGRREDVTLKNGERHSVTLSSEELKSINLSNVSGNVQVTSFYEVGQDPNTLTKDNKLSLTRQYLVDGKPTTSFKEGDVVQVRLTPKVNASALDGGYQIVDFLPSGLKPISNPYSIDGGWGYRCSWYPQKIVNNKLYFLVPKNFSTYSSCEPAIQYYARVVTKGDFTANPALLQSVLNPDSLNISESAKVNIK
jgi:uncharacterized protein YfaS (alpha-2-macroglobulin family)